MWYFELHMGKYLRTIYEQISMNDSFVQNILENLFMFRNQFRIVCSKYQLRVRWLVAVVALHLPARSCTVIRSLCSSPISIACRTRSKKSFIQNTSLSGTPSHPCLQSCCAVLHTAPNISLSRAVRLRLISQPKQALAKNTRVGHLGFYTWLARARPRLEHRWCLVVVLRS